MEPHPQGRSFRHPQDQHFPARDSPEAAPSKPTPWASAESVNCHRSSSRVMRDISTRRVQRMNTGCWGIYWAPTHPAMPVIVRADLEALPSNQLRSESPDLMPCVEILSSYYSAKAPSCALYLDPVFKLQIRRSWLVSHTILPSSRSSRGPPFAWSMETPAKACKELHCS